LDQLTSVTLTITIKDADGNTTGTDTVTISADAYQGNFFEGAFTGNYNDTGRNLLDLVATFNWTTGDPTNFVLDHQSAAGNGTVNVFTWGNVVIVAPGGTTTDDDQTTSPGGTNTDGGNIDGDGADEGDSDDQGSDGSTGNNTNNNNTVTIDETPAPAGAAVPPAADMALEDAAPEMAQTVILDDEATPLADAPADPDVPQTGVAEDSALFILTLLGSLAGIVALARKRDTIME